MSATAPPATESPARPAGPPSPVEAPRRRWFRLAGLGGRPARCQLEAIRPLVEAIRDRGRDLAGIGDQALRGRGLALRRRARAGESPDDLLVETFAVVREAADRALGQRPFDVQIAGGIALHQGRLVEMGTGEGKTLAAVAPVCLEALAGRGAHVLTFNDYLARRDAGWMEPVYGFLGLEVGHVQEGMTAAGRQRAYSREVTYLTAKEAGFDLLRDGLCLDRGDQVHRPFRFALLDEADSILIDEARIPLVIAGAWHEEHSILPRLAALARTLRPGVDIGTDEYGHNIFLTERGATWLEAELGRGSLFEDGNVNLLAAARNALHAEHLLRRDVDYIVRKGAVELVDEFTGRVAEKRHWPDGLQAAVEAKEGLRLGSDGRILGSITLQHLLKLYPRLCGMTATALSSAEELREVYGLEVSVIPPNRPCIRVDHPDLVYTHREARDRAVIREIARIHSSGRPVLVGTASVFDSERLASELGGRGVPCQVLNAKNDEREAAIVAEAGAIGAVTISTNMAGRGTDIRLGGREELDREKVVSLGGLYVIGTNRHESSRIDRQLRGRAGRQGDPGSSRFFISMEDDLLRRYGLSRLVPRRHLPGRSEDPVDSPVVMKEVSRVQRIVEGESFDVRRRLYEYSDVIERQRGYVSAWRQAVLENPSGPGLLAERVGERWRRLLQEFGPEVMDEVERRLTLIVIDRCWSDYLNEMQAVRDEVHLVRLDGRTPLAEFIKAAIKAFERMVPHAEEEIVRAFASLEIGAGGVDWEGAGQRGPSATWTYLVSDNAFGNNVLQTLANRPSIGLWGALMNFPLLFLWGLYLRWKRRRREPEPGD